MPRKRSVLACDLCHKRKVRCDVEVRGISCTNCRLDGKTCAVCPRKLRLLARRAASEVRAAWPHIFTDSDLSDGTRQRILELKHDSASNASESGTAPLIDELDCTDSIRHVNPPTSGASNSWMSFDRVLVSNDSAWDEQSRYSRSINTTVCFSLFPFLVVTNCARVKPQDVNYLDSQGCFHIPDTDILNEFMRHYFLRTHPLLPIINEGDFWDMYDRPRSSEGKMPLLVFYAMLFAACDFLPQGIIAQLGFANIRAARATLYYRTKLLYDSGIEDNPVYLAQAALLLSYWSPGYTDGMKRPNSAWLTLAIQHGKAADAPIYAAMKVGPQFESPHQRKQQVLLKRLWWCCLIRDRILSLAVRRPIQITSSCSDFKATDGLAFEDFEDEAERSKVYGPTVKRKLIKILIHVAKLCVVVTSLNALVFPPEDAPHSQTPSRLRCVDLTTACKVALQVWYDGAKEEIQLFRGGRTPDFHVTSPDTDDLHDSVVLYTNLMSMYYHSAKAALSHHEALNCIPEPDFLNLDVTTGSCLSINQVKQELQEAISGITDCLGELLERGLVGYLPITAVACIALPLFLSVLSASLTLRASKPSMIDRLESQATQQRLIILFQVISILKPRYEGVDFLSEMIKCLVSASQPNLPFEISTACETSRVLDWTDIFETRLNCYLRLAMALDIVLRDSRLPQEVDFPEQLRRSSISRLICQSFPETLDIPVTSFRTPDTDIGSSEAIVADGGTVNNFCGALQTCRGRGKNWIMPGKCVGPDIYSNDALTTNDDDLESLFTDEPNDKGSLLKFGGGGTWVQPSAFDERNDTTLLFAMLEMDQLSIERSRETQVVGIVNEDLTDYATARVLFEALEVFQMTGSIN